jgi:hypothetical protein
MSTEQAQRPESDSAGTESARSRERRERANERARVVRDAYREALKGGPVVRVTTAGSVIVEAVELVNENGLECLEVRAAPGEAGETQWRIFNPPTGVREADGSITVDPLGALCATLAAHGGARKDRGRRRR